MTAGLLLLASFAAAPLTVGPLAFPDPAQLKSEGFRRLRGDTASAVYAKPQGRDTLHLLLEWRGKNPWSATFSREAGFEEDWILEQLAHFAPGASPHPLPDPGPSSPALAHFPGLKQHWTLRGRTASAWMGAGLRGYRHFLVFRAEAPLPVDEGKGPLRLRREAAAALDSAEGWVAAPCPELAAWAAIRCYRPLEDSRFLVRVAPYPKGLQIEIRQEGDALSEVRAAAESIPELLRADYARDLSPLLHGEALRLLAKAARSAPLFSWPDWRFLEWKGGVVPPQDYLEAWKKAKRLPDPLPALDYRDGKIRVKVEIHLNGQSRIAAEEIR